MSFLADFVAYMKTRTDCPPDFHLHAGMAALSVAMGNSVWCDGWTREIYPNLWTVLIAPSGFGKSGPLDMAQTVLNHASLGDNILPASFSQESLFDNLKANASIGVFFPQEFAAFLATLSREYNAGARETLTELYDVPDVFRRTLRKETIRLERPFVTILGASSPSWFADTYRANDLRGGFLARFVFCPSDTPGKPVDDPGPRDTGREAQLAGHAQRLSELRGRVDLSRVRQKLIEWDRLARKRLRDDCPPEFQGMRSRAGLLVRKAAMVFMASRNPETLVAEPRDLDLAVKYVERAHTDAERYLSEEVAQSRGEADALRLFEIVRRKNGHVPRAVAMRNAHLDARSMKEAVNTLVDSGRVALLDGDLVAIRTTPRGTGDFTDFGNSQIRCEFAANNANGST